MAGGALLGRGRGRLSRARGVGRWGSVRGSAGRYAGCVRRSAVCCERVREESAVCSEERVACDERARGDRV